jgi:cadmium resistance protein CadD (predicted permease)
MVDLAVIGQAVGMFAVTNVDDIVVLTLFFGQAQNRVGAWRMAIGQYLGYVGILIVSVLGGPALCLAAVEPSSDPQTGQSQR